MNVTGHFFDHNELIHPDRYRDSLLPLRTKAPLPLSQPAFCAPPPAVVQTRNFMTGKRARPATGGGNVPTAVPGAISGDMVGSDGEESEEAQAEVDAGVWRRQADHELYERALDAVALFVGACGLPPQILDAPEFSRMLDGVHAKLRQVSGGVARRRVRNLVGREAQRLARLLEGVDMYSVVVDTARVRSRRYGTIVVRWVDAEFFVHEVAVGVVECAAREQAAQRVRAEVTGLGLSVDRMVVLSVDGAESEDGGHSWWWHPAELLHMVLLSPSQQCVGVLPRAHRDLISKAAMLATKGWKYPAARHALAAAGLVRPLSPAAALAGGVGTHWYSVLLSLRAVRAAGHVLAGVGELQDALLDAAEREHADDLVHLLLAFAAATAQLAAAEPFPAACVPDVLSSLLVRVVDARVHMRTAAGVAACNDAVRALKARCRGVLELTLPAAALDPRFLAFDFLRDASERNTGMERAKARLLEAYRRLAAPREMQGGAAAGAPGDGGGVGVGGDGFDGTALARMMCEVPAPPSGDDVAAEADRWLGKAALRGSLPMDGAGMGGAARRCSLAALQAFMRRMRAHYPGLARVARALMCMPGPPVGMARVLARVHVAWGEVRRDFTPKTLQTQLTLRARTFDEMECARQAAALADYSARVARGERPPCPPPDPRLEGALEELRALREVERLHAAPPVPPLTMEEPPRVEGVLGDEDMDPEVREAEGFPLPSGGMGGGGMADMVDDDAECGGGDGGMASDVPAHGGCGV